MFTNDEIGTLLAMDLPALPTVAALCTIAQKPTTLTNQLVDVWEQAINDAFANEGQEPKPVIEDDTAPVESDSERWFFTVYDGTVLDISHQRYMTAKVWAKGTTYYITANEIEASLIYVSLAPTPNGDGLRDGFSTLQQEIPCSQQLYYNHTWIEGVDIRTVRKGFEKFVT